MSAASVEYPQPSYGARPMTLLEAANEIMERLPGYRAEIIGDNLTVTPPPDTSHERALKKLAAPLVAAGLDDGEESEIFHGIGVWLPDGSDDFAIPDLCLVDADIDDHKVTNNCYDPVAFRLVLEVTSSNYNSDLRTKVAAYANAKIPVYVIIDRKHDRVHVLTEPSENTYDSHRIHAAGEQITLPESIGAEVKLDVAQLLQAGKSRT